MTIDAVYQGKATPPKTPKSSTPWQDAHQTEGKSREVVDYVNSQPAPSSRSLRTETYPDF